MGLSRIKFLLCRAEGNILQKNTIYYRFLAKKPPLNEFFQPISELMLLMTWLSFCHVVPFIIGRIAFNSFFNTHNVHNIN